jgi:hypothetical protein
MKLYASIGFEAEGGAKALYVGPNADEAIATLEKGAKGIVEVEIYRLHVPWKRRLTPDGAKAARQADEAREKKAAEAAERIVAENARKKAEADKKAKAAAAKAVEENKTVSPKQVQPKGTKAAQEGGNETEN